jgi:hypothetical protein
MMALMAVQYFGATLFDYLFSRAFIVGAAGGRRLEVVFLRTPRKQFAGAVLPCRRYGNYGIHTVKDLTVDCPAGVQAWDGGEAPAESLLWRGSYGVLVKEARRGVLAPFPFRLRSWNDGIIQPQRRV